MLMRILACALLAGGIAGGISALLQQALVVPVLLEAELYETGEAVHFAAGDTAHAATGQAEGPAADGHAHANTHESGGDLTRHLTTAVMTIALNVGFAMLLLAGFYARGDRPDLRQGLIWGVGGFAAFMLAPAAGLAPELPGVAAAALESRQIWWAVTVVLTAGGIWLIAFVRTGWALPAAIALIVVPHLVGAPEPGAPTGPAPPEIAADFAARVLVVGFVSWAVLGAISAWIWRRLEGAHV